MLALLPGRSTAAAGKLWYLQGLLARCTSSRDFKGTPSQILCLADALSFTQRAEAAIQQGTLPKLKVRCGLRTSLLHTEPPQEI